MRSLLAFVAVTFGVAFFASQFTPGPWYEALAKPSWNPPNWIFGPVWSVLYSAIAVSGWMIWRTDSPRRTRLLTVFAIQLVLNALWSWLFFGMHAMGWALFEILLLVAVVAWMIPAFRRERAMAGWLLVPYLAWVGFASFLNFTIWRLN